MTTPFELVQGKTIEGESLPIDNKEFVDCIFVNCVLEYHGRSVLFTRTQFRGCRYVFFDSARSTVQFLELVGLLTTPGEWGEQSETVN